MEEAGTYNIATLLKLNAERFRNDNYIYEKIDGKYEAHTHKEFVRDVHNFAGYLKSLGLTDKKTGIYAKNSYDYMVADIAVMGYVGICATLSKEWELFDLVHSIELLNLEAIIYSQDKAEIIIKLKERYPDMVYIPIEEVTSVGTYNLNEERPHTDKCCKIIFSSGTTGLPKAVMLSQKNMFASWDNLYKRVPMNHSDVCYLFLPLSHTYAGICNFLYSLISGMTIYLCSTVSKMFDELQEVKPTVFCAVPLIFERLYSLCMQNRLEPEMVLGGKIRYLFCGGAYFNPEIRAYLKKCGLNLYEAYGLTETSSLISVEYPNQTDFNSVGTIFENLDLEIENPDEKGIGEIIVKGDNISEGYFNNPESTGKVYDERGYFHTGDLGYVKNNKLYITGRKKRMILLSNGENVYPEDIEEMFHLYDGINKVKVYEKDNKIAAVFFVGEDMNIGEIVEEINAKLPGYSKIKEYKVMADSIELRMK